MHPCYAYWKWRGGKRINNKLIWKSVLIDVITWGIRVQSRNEAFTHTKQWGSLFPMMRIFFCFSNGNYVSMRCVCLSIWNINQRGQLSHEYLLSNHTCNGLLMTLTNGYRLETPFKYYYSMTIYVCTKFLRTYSILEMKNSHVMAWSSFTLAQTKDDIKKCEGKPAIMRTKAGFHYIEKWVSKSQKWKKSRKKENYANSIVQRFKTTNSLRFRKRSGCIQLTIGGILNHKMRKWMIKQKEKKVVQWHFVWEKW